MNAAVPPIFCISAITCSVKVVLPDDSGPYTSTTRPRGKPPIPRAMSSPSEPVETTSMSSATWPSAMRMIEPLPNCFSICANAAARAFCRSFVSVTAMLLPSSIAASAPSGRGGPSGPPLFGIADLLTTVKTYSNRTVSSYSMSSQPIS